MFTPLKRFDKKILPEPNSGCWLWTGSVDRGGYGFARFQNRMGYAHRAVYEMLVGPIPEGYEVDHKCFVPCCVNPAHLRSMEYFAHRAMPKSKNRRKRKTVSENEREQRYRRHIEYMRNWRQSGTDAEREARRQRKNDRARKMYKARKGV